MADIHRTGVAAAELPPGMFCPAARNPVPAVISVVTTSPGCWGRAARATQACPSGLVNVTAGPTATHPAEPPATSVGACPAGGALPSAAWTGASRQLRPALPENRKRARPMRPPDCAPTATMSPPTAATWESCVLMPRPASAGVPVKSAAAVRAGGKPADSCDGGRLPEPLFAPAAMTTATPTVIATVMGMKRPVIRLRVRIARITSRIRDARDGAGAGAGVAGRHGTASSPPVRSSLRSGAAHSDRNSCGGGTGTCGPLEMVGV